MFAHLRRHDWILNGAALTLAAISLVMIMSAAPALFVRQAVWFALGALTIAVSSVIDWRPIVAYRWTIFGIYLVAVLLLVLTLFAAPVIRHTRSWLLFGPFQFQASEFAKVAFLITLSYFFARRHGGIAHVGNIVRSFLYFAILVALVLLQPDWGSGFIFFGLWVSFLLMSGIRLKHLFIGFGAFIAVAVFAWFFILADYQKARIVGFLEPGYDPLGVNYSAIQSKIAIGSAGWLGKGFRQGPQVQLGFLPEPATDFIFAAFIEEWGFAGGIFLLVVFAALLTRIILIGFRSPNAFGAFMSLGTAMVFLIHFALNVGSNIGFLPVVGIPFPFLSYGGSSILTEAMLVGIIQSIAIRSSL